MESYRKSCLKRQAELRRIMTRSERHDEAIHLFLSQHAMLHSAKMAGLTGLRRRSVVQVTRWMKQV